MTGATLSRRAARIENRSAELELVPSLTVMRMSFHMPDAQSACRSARPSTSRTTPTTAGSGSSSAASRLRDRSRRRGRNTCEPTYTQLAGVPRNGGPLVGRLGLGASGRREEEQQADQHRQAQRAETFTASMRTLWTLETSMAKLAARACALRALVSRKGSGATGRSPSGRLHANGLSRQSAAATPLSVSAAVQRIRGPEALRHRLSTVLPLVRRCAVCRAARDVKYRAAPHRRAADAGKASRVEDDGDEIEHGMRDARHAFADSSHSGSVKPCWRTSRVQAATRCRS